MSGGVGRVGDADQALVNQAASHLGPTGFDPSRDDEFWGPEIVVNGVMPDWLGEREKFVWLKTDRWLDHYRKPMAYGRPSFAACASEWTWRFDDERPNICAIRLPADHPAYSLPRDSDGSSEAGETHSGSTVGDSAGRETASPNADRTPA